MKIKPLSILLILILALPIGFFSPTLPDAPDAANPVVQGMLDQVAQADLETMLKELSGAQAAVIGGQSYTITSRYSLLPNHISKATQYGYEHLDSLGLEVQYHTYRHPWDNSLQRNVIATQVGRGQAERLFLVTAHIDSTSNAAGYDPAPGADDNGTGSTAVLTIARILSQYDFDCSIRYALFTGEEQGLYGSSAYAQSLRTAEVNVEGVLNLDMLGYNTEGSLPTMELHTRPTKASDLAIAHAFTTTVSDYGLNLIPLVLRDGERASDHAPFWDRGYPAIMAIEDWNDHTPKYHRTTDTVPSLNLPYTTQFVKAALGTMARLGCLLDGQAQGVVRSAGQPLPGAVVEAWQDGQIVRSAVTAADGSYRLPLLPGDYDLAFRAAGHQGVMTPAVQVVQKQAVVTDQDLSACQTATDLSFSVDPPRPQPGQNVHFSAFANGAQPLSYTWRFGDGVEAAGATVDHTFAALGAYTITLSADNVCIYPISTQGNLTVSHYVLYMPLMGK